MEIIYATSNKNKVKQLQELIKDNNLDIKVITLDEIGFKEEVEETGATLEENSMIKAKAVEKYCIENKIEKPILADDAGLLVDALNGEPGVYSGRYAGPHATQEQILNKLLKNLENVSEEKRTAKFMCALTLLTKNNTPYVVIGEMKGKIALKPGTMGGLTYTPVFILEGNNKPMSDMPAVDLKNTHRGKAFIKILEHLKEKHIKGDNY